MMANTTLSLQDRFKQLKEEQPRIRARYAADTLGVSETELLDSACDGEKVVRLQGPWTDLIKQIETLGYVLALTRNEWAVHMTKGNYTNIKFHSHAGVVLGEGIDLRIFPHHWKFGFATKVTNSRGTLHSLQFFEPGGSAIHKVYLKDESEGLDAYKQLIKDFRHPDQSPSIVITSSEQTNSSDADEVDTDALLDAWKELQSTHDFYPMLRDHKVTRLQAIRLGEDTFTRKISNDSVQKMLSLAIARQVPIMTFVGSRGVVQIHSGEIKRTERVKPWLNIRNPEFNMHLRDDLIAESWIVEKPTEDGTITSLELFSKDGSLIVNFFGQRKFGDSELESWREILGELAE